MTYCLYERKPPNKAKLIGKPFGTENLAHMKKIARRTASEDPEKEVWIEDRFFGHVLWRCKNGIAEAEKVFDDVDSMRAFLAWFVLPGEPPDYWVDVQGRCHIEPGNFRFIDGAHVD